MFYLIDMHLFMCTATTLVILYFGSFLGGVLEPSSLQDIRNCCKVCYTSTCSCALMVLLEDNIHL